MERKFKIGDRVKLLDAQYTTYGKVGVVTGYGNVLYYAQCLKGGKELCYFEGDLEAVEDCNNKIVITSDGKNTFARLYDGKKVIREGKAVCSPDDTFDFEVGAKLAVERLLETEKKQEKAAELKIQVGKKYKIKAYDNTNEHYGLSKSTWDEIFKHPVYPCEGWENSERIFCGTGYCGYWFIPRTAFECEWKGEIKEEVKKEKKSFPENCKVRCTGYNKTERAFTVGKVYEVKGGTIVSDRGFEYHKNGYPTVIDFLNEWYNFELVEEESQKKDDKKPEFKEGDIFEVISKNHCPKHFFEVGTMVRIKTDDGTHSPVCVDIKSGRMQYVNVADMKKIES